MPFSFNLTGLVVGFNSDKTGRFAYFNIKPDADATVDVETGDSIGLESVRIPMDKVPSGVSPGARVSVSGVGYIGVRSWTNPSTQKTKEIDNLRLHGREIKLAR